jgi:hypothetical protein
MIIIKEVFSGFYMVFNNLLDWLIYTLGEIVGIIITLSILTAIIYYFG